jgi:peptidoglycan/xylan/chitin deacetylase (PgdA/CDA1 family)
MTADPGRGTSDRLLILTYHDISDGPAPLAIPPARFADHVRSLRDGGWSTLPLREVTAGLAGGRWPSRSVFITFDDGVRSVVDVALPALVDAGMTAAVFVVSGALTPGADAPRLCGPPMDAGALRAAVAAGLEIGAHGITHRALSRLQKVEIEREILGSRTSLEDLLGVPIRAFAYPFGDAPVEARAVVRATFDAGVGVTMGRVSPQSRVEHLERIDAHYLRHWSNLADLDGLVARAYLSVRAAGRRVRNARTGP